jgi:UDP-glucose 6-dehydrogenase
MPSRALSPTEQLMDAPVVGFAGMTHLGVVSAIGTAARGFSVIGYDAEESLVGRLNRQELPILEPDLDRLLAANRDRIGFTATLSDLSGCEVVYIAADVPTDDEGAGDLSPIAALIERVSRHPPKVPTRWCSQRRGRNLASCRFLISYGS